MKASFTIIIPCYNEAKNLEKLFGKINTLKKKINFNTIIINNGSKDSSKKILEKLQLKKKLKNTKIIQIKNNIGFGNAIKKGILKSETSILCYTHADLQTDINDIYRAYIIFSRVKHNFFIKGNRVNRNFKEIIFTLFMGLINSFLFRVKLFDIHAQPTFFEKKMIKNINYLPNDFSIDTFLMLLAFFKKKKIIRFKVKFKKRKYGVGSNERIIDKVIYSIKSIGSSLKILFFGKYKQ